MSASDVEAYLSSVEPNMASRAPLDISFYGKEWYGKQLQNAYPDISQINKNGPNKQASFFMKNGKTVPRSKVVWHTLLAIPDTSPKLEGLFH